MKDMMEYIEEFLAVAIEAVKKAEPIFCKHFGKPSGVLMKQGNTPSLVSDADREIETLLSKEISGSFPAHSIVGEEFPATGGASEFIWYIDPIDGTTNYVHGFPHCAISVSVWDKKCPLVGVVSDPINHARYTAFRGNGAFKNNRRIHVSTRSSLSDCLGAVGWRWNDVDAGVRLLHQFAPSAYRLRVLGSSALELCFVAEGALDFFANSPVALWDVAAGALILAEANGVATDLTGENITAVSKTIVASNRLVHQQVLSALQSDFS